MRNRALMVLIALLMAGIASAEESSATETSQATALAWLELIDSGRVAESWQETASLFQRAISQSGWVKALQAARDPFGAIESRSVLNATYTRTLPGAPDGEYVVMQFQAAFERKANAVETVTTMKDDGVWRVSGYFIK